MRSYAALLVLATGLISSVYAAQGKTYTTWDCCKPACAWQSNVRGGQGVAKTCDVNNNLLNGGGNAKSACDANANGTAYLCDAYQPTPTQDNFSYGFAAMPGNNCCKCYQLTWTSGGAQGKQMVVQIINQATGGDDGKGNGEVRNDDIVILTPGGGTGPYESGCLKQYGGAWGNQNGGVGTRDDCLNLPTNLQGGCYWRFNWARGNINGWSVTYNQVQCPSRLTSISGCSA